jgi:cobalt-zinc-cadmium efflux system membrane fusion protein
MGGVAAAAGLVVAGCSSYKLDRSEAMRATSDEVRFESGSPKLDYLHVETVGTRREKVVAVLPAQVVMDEDHTVRITSPVVGRVTELLARAGDHVARGQPLARITSGDLAQAATDLVKAAAAAQAASAALARAQDLYEHKVIALKDLEQARTDDAQASAEQERAKLRVRQLGASGGGVEGELVLRAPFSGTVVDRGVNLGSEVRNDNGQVLFMFSALDSVWIVASAYARDLPAVRPGERLLFTTDAAPGRQFAARVLRVGNALDPQTHTATLTATIPNPGGELRPMVFGEARVLASESGTEPVVTDSALVTHGAGSVVFVQVGPGRFERRPVTIGQDDGVVAVITSGLKPGERVVTRGSLLLSQEVDH